MSDRIIVLKVGGSLLSPDKDTLFDFEYAELLVHFLSQFKDKQFVLTTGGGALSRYYQRHSRFMNLTVERKHWLGIAAINMNAEALFSLVEETVYPEVLRYNSVDSKEQLEFKQKFLISAAGSPGHSSDYNAFTLAKRVGSKTIISMSNTDGIYTADPKKDPLAEKINATNWDEYLKIIGNPAEHVPGANYPIDPIAARYAKEHGLELLTIHGKDLEQLRVILEGEDFNGSKIC